MPRLGNYSKCKMYKIVSMNNPDLVYFGHTCDTLSRRFSKHKSSSNTTTSKIIIEKGDAIIILLEEYPCENEMVARSREAYYILNNNCVNKQIPGRTQKEYRDSHKEKMNEYQKEYHNSHKEKSKEYYKLYYLKNKANNSV